MAKEANTKPVVDDVIDISQKILLEFARFGVQHFEANQTDATLQGINEDYNLYEHLFRETLASLLGIKLSQSQRLFTIACIAPFTKHLKGYLKGQQVAGENAYVYVIKWKAYIIEATNRLIDKLILHVMFDNDMKGLSNNNGCKKD